jgi:hypothetical protein
MKYEHLGRIVDIDPGVAALDNSIVRQLRRLGPLTQKDLWLRVRNRGLALEGFQAAVDRLVELGVLVREMTHYRNSFVLRLKENKEQNA